MSYTSAAAAREERRVERVLEKASSWLGLDGVEYVGRCTIAGRVCLLVGVSQEPAAMRELLPPVLDGFEVHLQTSGPTSWTEALGSGRRDARRRPPSA